MSRKTLALLTGLLVITGILLALALTSSKKQPTTPGQQPVTSEPSPTTPVAFTTLRMEPSTVSVENGTGTVDVMMDTDQNDVTAIQLELAYDPAVLSNVRVTAAEFFPNAQVLINQNDTESGFISYAIGIAPQQQTIKGTGRVATITFNVRSGADAATTELNFRPLTLVTAQGISTSVLKEATGAVITLPQ